MAWNLAEIPQIPCNDRSGGQAIEALGTFLMNIIHSRAW
jgi:hypothetical protein